jgi:nitrogen regulatory protein PII
MKSNITANTIAAVSVATTTDAGKGVIAIPPMAKMVAIRTSLTDEAATQTLGREDHRRPRARFV